MAADDDDVSQLLDVARAAARRPEPDPPSDRKPGQPKPRPAAASRRVAVPVPEPSSRPKGPLVALGIVVLFLLLAGSFALGRATAPATNAAASASIAADAPLDEAEVASLLDTIAKNPDDAATLKTLGNVYYSANDYANALTYYEKVVALDPKGENGWIAVAAAAYQSGDRPRAFAAWNAALDINPDNIEAHYGLGHYYLDETPSDEAKARAEWEKVIALDPTSPQAEEVKADLDSLSSAPAAPSASPS